jgi:hypothetical protein
LSRSRGAAWQSGLSVITSASPPDNCRNIWQSGRHVNEPAGRGDRKRFSGRVIGCGDLQERRRECSSMPPGGSRQPVSHASRRPYDSRPSGIAARPSMRQSSI